MEGLAISANIKESITDLNNALEAYDRIDDKNMKSIIGNSIRMSFDDLDRILR